MGAHARVFVCYEKDIELEKGREKNRARAYGGARRGEGPDTRAEAGA